MGVMGRRGFSWSAVLVVVGLLAWAIVDRALEGGGDGRSGRAEDSAAPVEVSAIEHGAIELRRALSGTLEAAARFVVAPKVSGRIERLAVDLGDEVSRGQVVAELDNEEYVQAVRQAEAELAVTRANRIRAENDLKVARRELDRIRSLWQRDIASDTELEQAEADKLTRESALAIAEAEIKRAESAVKTAKIRLGYTTITADWNEGDDTRIVGERYVDEGDTVAANARLLSIVELDPIKAVISVTERDYGRLRVGQPVEIRTDTFPGETFAGEIARIAPVFQEGSRQARVELTASNPDRQLKPGMFVRANVLLERIADATIVPADALVIREGRQGVFVVAEEDNTVRWQPVTPGIQEGNRLQVMESGLTGRVVTLGQHLLDDGSAITIPDSTPMSSAKSATEEASQ